MTPRVLVAGIGNVFLGDDGFGVEVVRRLAEVSFPDWVRIADYGISGMHLAFDLLDGYDTTILVDAVARGEAPGTLYVIELRDEHREDTQAPGGFDAHGMQPEAVLELVDQLGGHAGRVLVVGCEPQNTAQCMELTAPVERALPEAVRKVRELIRAEEQRFTPHSVSQEV